jgi:hypothetical protein
LETSPDRASVVGQPGSGIKEMIPMGYLIDKIRVKALLALGPVLLFAGLALLPSTASATRVTTEATPKAETVKLTSTDEPKLLPANAFAATFTKCEKAHGFIEAPAEEEANFFGNMNRTGVGTHSTGPGGVVMPLVNEANEIPPAFEPIVFETCGVFEFVEVSPGVFKEEKLAEAKVTTTNANGNWKASADSIEFGSEAGQFVNAVTIAVPPSSATIEVPALACKVVVSEGEASPVSARYANPPEAGKAGTLTVDSQLQFGGTCGLPSPAQFEGHFSANKSLTIEP